MDEPWRHRHLDRQCFVQGTEEDGRQTPPGHRSAGVQIRRNIHDDTASSNLARGRRYKTWQSTIHSRGRSSTQPSIRFTPVVFDGPEAGCLWKDQRHRTLIDSKLVLVHCISFVTPPCLVSTWLPPQTLLLHRDQTWDDPDGSHGPPERVATQKPPPRRLYRPCDGPSTPSEGISSPPLSLSRATLLRCQWLYWFFFGLPLPRLTVWVTSFSKQHSWLGPPARWLWRWVNVLHVDLLLFAYFVLVRVEFAGRVQHLEQYPPLVLSLSIEWKRAMALHGTWRRVWLAGWRKVCVLLAYRWATAKDGGSAVQQRRRVYVSLTASVWSTLFQSRGTVMKNGTWSSQWTHWLRLQRLQLSEISTSLLLRVNCLVWFDSAFVQSTLGRRERLSSCDCASSLLCQQSGTSLVASAGCASFFSVSL